MRLTSLRLRGRSLRHSSRIRALSLLWNSSRSLTLGAITFIVAEGTLPVLVLVAMARVVAAIPGAVEFGLSSGPGQTLLVNLAVAGAVYGLSLIRGPAEDALTAAATARVDALMQRRLVQAVCAPVGIEHLEDREVIEQLASARGELLGGQPAGAPIALVSQLGDRLTGLLACVVLVTFRWWIGVGLLVMWLAVRRPLGDGLRAQATRVRSAAEPLRRSWYLLGLAWRPAAGKEMRVFGLADWVAERHAEEWLEGTAPAWQDLRRLNRAVLVAAGVVLIAYGLAVTVLGLAANHDEISLQTLVTMVMMLPASMAIGSVSYGDINLEKLLASVPDLETLTAALNRRAAPARAGAPAATLPQRFVRFERVTFCYPGRDDPVLHELDLELAVGASLGLVGINGAGKTTLVTLLARMREPTGGRISVDGVSLDTLSAREWQRQVAVVYQDFARLPMTATQNIAMFGDRPVDAQALARASELAGAAELVAGLPRGWDTVLSPQYTGGIDLSGGQWQRIALARALYAVQTGARVLVLDEPTAQLDVRAEVAFYDRFLELTAGVTSVIISHRFTSVRRATRIAVLDGGRIAEIGSHQELLDLSGTYAEMFHLQAARFRDGGSAA